MELPKLGEESTSLDGGLESWLLFLKGVHKNKWEELAMNTPELKKAMTTLEFLSQDKETRYLYEMRQKALLDEASFRDWAENAEANGIEKGKAEVAKQLLVEVMEESFVEKVTGLSQIEIQKLKEQIR